MEDYALRLTDDEWQYGCYPRGTYKTDNLYKFYSYKDIYIQYNHGRAYVTDQLIDRLEGYFSETGISSAGVEAPFTESEASFSVIREEYNKKLEALFRDPRPYDDWPVEKIYGLVQKLRIDYVGVAALEYDWKRRAKTGVSFDEAAARALFSYGTAAPDISEKKQELFNRSHSVIFVLSDPEWMPQMIEDTACALGEDKQAYVVVCPQKGGQLPDEELIKSVLSSSVATGRIIFLKSYDEALGFDPGSIRGDDENLLYLENCRKDIDEGKALLTVYGEEGLLVCRHLNLNALVYAIPRSFLTRIMTDQTDGDYPCMELIPAHFDIIRQVPLTERTRISYRQLALLWENYKDEMDSLTEDKNDLIVEELYARHPQIFINIYENGPLCPEDSEDWPLQVRFDEKKKPAPGDIIPELYRLRDDAIHRTVSGQNGVDYISVYFDENINLRDIPWEARDQQSGILVEGISLSHAKDSKVIRCGGRTLRQIFREDGSCNFGFVSNFLFFVTPKLASHYNELRGGRHLEQADISGGHLDYLLERDANKRTETFPLYRKACIAMTDDGEFLFFRYRLGGGSLKVGRSIIKWPAKAVDVRENEDDHPVIVYTPYLSRMNEGAPGPDYVLPVGEGRLNLIVIQDKLIAARLGEVLLPSVGVVISLRTDKAQEFLKKEDFSCAGDGYYNICEDTKVDIVLDGPSEIPEKTWHKVRWAYGGGLSLILDGVSLYGAGKDEESVREEGWLCPLSCQTQETPIHLPAKHPRTAIGIRDSGELFVLVFSGRTRLSTGADYDEMCRIAKTLFPDVRYMMNVDGGGSAMLGMVLNGNFMELSYPATSPDSCAGMARPVNTAFYISIDSAQEG